MTGPNGRPFTPEQREAIARRRGSLLLSANAGSGKTAVMVERFVRAVREDGAGVGQILAITFTEKAAAELRTRLRARFAEVGDHASARATERASVSTIHGFCAGLLRAHALDAGVDPEFRMLTEHELELLERAAFSQAVDELVREEPGAVDVVAAYRVDPLLELITTTHARLRSRGQHRPGLPPLPAAGDLEEPARELRAAADALAGHLRASGREHLKTIAGALDALGGCADVLDAHGVPALSHLDPLRVGNRTAELQGEEAGRYREALGRYRQACADHHARPAYATIDSLLGRYADRYAQLKRDRGALDFEDLELLTTRLLSDDRDLRERVAARYVAIMVDEFQDTNRVQLELLRLLSRDNLFAVGDEFQSIYGFRHADVTIMRELARELPHATLATNFRSRGPILDALNLAFGGREGVFGERFVPLRAGRADAGVPAGASGPGRGEPPAPAVELLVADCRAWEAEAGDGEPASSAWRAGEARLLARHVRSLLDEGDHGPGDVVVLLRATTDIQLYDRALVEQGVPTYVLGGHGYWSHPQVRDVVAYLGLLANPLDSRRLYEVLASPLASASTDALVLLATAARRARRPAWTVLREALGGGAGAGENQDGDGAALALPAADAERLGAFLARFDAHRDGAGRASLDTLVDRIVTDTGYDLQVLAMPGGERRMANLRKLMRLAREHDERDGGGLRAFVDLVDALTGDPLAEAREGEAPVEAEAVDAVRLMTVHRAKGLEYPVVYVADLGRKRPTTGRELLRVGAGGQVGLKLETLDGDRAGAFAYDALKEEQERELDDEERRLFYVATTRAQERLVLSGAVALGGSNASLPLAWLATALAPGALERMAGGEEVVDVEREWEGRPVRVRCVLNTPATEREAAAAGGTSGAVAVADALAGDDPGGGAPGTLPEVDGAAPLAPPARRAGPAGAQPPVETLSYSRLQSHRRCGYRYYVERVLRLPADEQDARRPAAEDAVDPLAPPGATLPARLRGSVVHDLLELVDFARPAVPDEEVVRAACAARGHDPTPVDVDDVRELIARFATGALCRRLAAFADVRREAPFTFSLDPEGVSGPLVNGVVDVLATGAQRTLVVDYKTDRLGDADPAAVVERDYGVQRDLYALAALRAGAREVEVVHCFLDRDDADVVARFTAGDAARLEGSLRAGAEDLLAGRFPVAEHPHLGLCGGCPARAALCSWPSEMTSRPAPDEPAPVGA